MVTDDEGTAGVGAGAGDGVGVGVGDGDVEVDEELQAIAATRTTDTATRRNDNIRSSKKEVSETSPPAERGLAAGIFQGLARLTSSMGSRTRPCAPSQGAVVLHQRID